MPYLNVGNGHHLHYQLQGELQQDNGQVIPLLFVHGGPGAGVKPADKTLLRDALQPVIFLDQRASGNSRYKDQLAANTTEHLIEDIELLRQTLGVEQFILVGGSWGSTLSLLYAIRYPQHVHRLLLWGIFLCRQQELDWFYHYGANQLFPDEYQRFIGTAQQIQSEPDVISAYFQLLTTGSQDQRQAAAAAWARWEAVNSFITPDEQTLTEFSDPDTALPMAILESYYFKHRAFIEQDYILQHIHRLGDTPLEIVQGRYDTICPCQSAWLLSRAYPHSRLHISPLAAHDASEPQNNAAIRHLLTRF